jgi:hypothetical protein
VDTSSSDEEAVYNAAVAKERAIAMDDCARIKRELANLVEQHYNPQQATLIAARAAAAATPDETTRLAVSVAHECFQATRTKFIRWCGALSGHRAIMRDRDYAIKASGTEVRLRGSMPEGAAAHIPGTDEEDITTSEGEEQ